MGLIVGFCRYALPILAFIILFKCFLTLLIGHPVNKTYGYIVNGFNAEKIPLNTWETSIGRSRSCDIILGYPSVSRFHAAICRRVDGWYIFDTNSKLGTFVNGEKIEREATIKNADILSFGDCQFQFVITDDPVIEVGRKRRSRKASVPQSQNSENAYSYRRADILQDSEPKPEQNVNSQEKTQESYDSFESIHIDFHPKKQQSEETYRGRIRDIYSDEGAYTSQQGSSPTVHQAKTREKQAAVVNLETGETFLLCGSGIVIGRSRTSDIKLDDRSVSRSHAVLSKKNGVWSISDCGSTFGTYVNAGRITDEVKLHDGDTIALSGVKLKFVEDYR